MVEQLRERPALIGPGGRPGTGAPELRECFGLTLIQVIARRGMAAPSAASLGLTLPEQANSVASDARATVYCLRPGDWLIIREDHDGRGGQAAQAWRRELAGMAAVIDQSHGRVVLDLAGDGAEALLQKGLNIDLDPALFAVGAMAQTGLVGIALLVHRRDERQFRLLVARSFAPSLADWLVQHGAVFFG